jgi:hypothetical protein
MGVSFDQSHAAHRLGQPAVSCTFELAETKSFPLATPLIN